MNSLEKEAATYLKSKKEYSNLMEALKEKYKKTGKLTGKVKLQSITTEEGLLLGAIDSSLFGAKEGFLSIKKFVDFFSIGRFEGIDFIIVLKEYFGVENLKTHREVKEEKSLMKEEFFINIFNKLKNPEIKLWLNAVIDYKKYGYQGIVRAYGENPRFCIVPDYCENQMVDVDFVIEQDKYSDDIFRNIDKSFDFIKPGSDEYIPLAKFASLVTKDSHYFDMDNFPGKLFIAAIGYLYNINIDKAESKNEALMKVNIIRDEISNFTITYGLMAYNEKEEVVAEENVVEETAEEVTEDEETVEDAEDTDDSAEGKEKKKLFGRKPKKDPRDEKIEELTDRVTRQMAEFDNFRKRTEKEKAAMYEIGAKSVIEKLLPVVDNFERGFSTVVEEDKDDAFVKGMEMVYKQIMTTFETIGVKPIEAVGQEFNPDLHNAVMHVDDESVGENIVVEEFQKGYTYHDSVVRYSMVKVAN